MKKLTTRILKLNVFIFLILTASTFQLMGQVNSIVSNTAPSLTPPNVNNNYMPFGAFWGYQRSQMHYTDAELLAGNLSISSGSHYITNVAFFVDNCVGQAANTPILIYMK